MRIDAHQHFWQFDPVRDRWIDDSMQVLRADFMPTDLKPLLDENRFDGCIAVQADQSEKETRFLLQLAAENSFIQGVVGWIDLQSDNLEERLQSYAPFKKLKGFRHIVQGESDDAFLLRPSFVRGIALLQKYGYTYDILIYPRHLKYALRLVVQFPHQSFIIDHIAKPGIKQQEIRDWKREMKSFSMYENVYCKVSGLVTEGDWQHWRQEDFIPYLDVVMETFGTNRLVYGSDWPVCLLAASYRQQLEIVQNYFASFSTQEQEEVFGGNAKRFYKLH